jgi:hypothetical protein
MQHSGPPDRRAPVFCTGYPPTFPRVRSLYVACVLHVLNLCAPICKEDESHCLLGCDPFCLEEDTCVLTLKLKTAVSSDTSVRFYQKTWSYVAKGSKGNIYCCEHRVTLKKAPPLKARIIDGKVIHNQIIVT